MLEVVDRVVVVTRPAACVSRVWEGCVKPCLELRWGFWFLDRSPTNVGSLTFETRTQGLLVVLSGSHPETPLSRVEAV